MCPVSVGTTTNQGVKRYNMSLNTVINLQNATMTGNLYSQGYNNMSPCLSKLQANMSKNPKLSTTENT